MQLKKTLYIGQDIPRFYWMGKYDHLGGTATFYPAPIAILIRAIDAVWDRFRLININKKMAYYESIAKDAYKQGYEEGYRRGYQEGEPWPSRRTSYRGHSTP